MGPHDCKFNTISSGDTVILLQPLFLSTHYFLYYNLYIYMPMYSMY